MNYVGPLYIFSKHDKFMYLLAAIDGEVIEQMILQEQIITNKCKKLFVIVLKNKNIYVKINHKILISGMNIL